MSECAAAVAMTAVAMGLRSNEVRRRSAALVVKA
jgi:hypothetical protein